MMTLKCLFIQRKEMYEGELAPELLAAVDEFTYDQNPEDHEAYFKEQLDEVKDEIVSHRIIEIEIDQDKVRRLLLNTPIITGEITSTD